MSADAAGRSVLASPIEMTYKLVRGAGADYVQLTPDLSALALHLNPAELVITSTPDLQGERLLLDFCLRLAREASILADELDPKFHAIPRHRKPRDESQPYDY